MLCNVMNSKLSFAKFLYLNVFSYLWLSIPKVDTLLAFFRELSQSMERKYVCMHVSYVWAERDTSTCHVEHTYYARMCDKARSKNTFIWQRDTNTNTRTSIYPIHSQDPALSKCLMVVKLGEPISHQPVCCPEWTLLFGLLFIVGL